MKTGDWRTTSAFDGTAQANKADQSGFPPNCQPQARPMLTSARRNNEPPSQLNNAMPPLR